MEYYLIRNIGAEMAGTAGSTAKIDFSSGTNYSANFRRQGVILANCGASPIYVKAAGRGSSAPTVTSGNYHWQVPAGSATPIHVTREVDLYIFGTTAYTAVEVG